MKTAVIPQVRVEPALREELDAVLGENETLSEFVEDAVRRAVEYRRVQAAFLAKGDQAWDEFQRTGQAIDADEVLATLQGRLDARRRQLQRR
jgi:predicted transcriptional regulator